MSADIKGLIVILAMSGLVFAIGKSTALQFMAEADFKRRRNVWMIVSAAAFLSPSFWLFAPVAAVALFWGGRKDTHPLAFYLLLINVIPSIPIQIPTHGLPIKQLFELDIFRLLSFCVLLPAAWRLRRTKDPNRIQGLQTMDLLLIGYGILTVAFYVSPDLAKTNNVLLHSSFTNVLRDALLFVVDIYVLYYVASRSCSSRRAIVDVLATFCLACTVMASVAVFESLKHWKLYTALYPLWGGHDLAEVYSVRAGLLRVSASAGHPLVFGYLLAVAFGFWLSLRSRLRRIGPKVAITLVLWAGLLVSLSRGPWLTAVLVYFAFATFRPGGASRLIKAGLVFLVIGGVVLASPLGDRLRQMMPGSGDSAAATSLEYRELLVESSWRLIKEYPLLGDQLALAHLQELRQGQGIIDVVNTYVQVTLFHGFVGLALFLSFILSALIKAYAAARRSPPFFPDSSLIGASLIACIIGTLLMLADCSFIATFPIAFYALAGIAAGYYRLSELPRTDAALGAAPEPSPEPT